MMASTTSLFLLPYYFAAQQKDFKMKSTSFSDGRQLTLEAEASRRHFIL